MNRISNANNIEINNMYSNTDYQYTIEYIEGQLAFENGDDSSLCPYPIGNSKRYNWLMGWYDVRLARFNHIAETEPPKFINRISKT